ncbi:hypothetical protein L211DRAFT_808963 [Terfezia boudieri ATCC MYA-4762]|uniref:Uncharacterized protein n=1 Tax=Terfezia boudieri ATCC MYA-4762 TaxID=1051890 RepID=A0A3N4M0R3_9PEZI|nr:hypothetical protein L211DRAFT_808963 [Terfezia boudieri ATCC MYA-4762]
MVDFDNERLSPRRFFPNISQVYTDLHEASSKVSLDIAKYCDVSHRQTLPFLFAGQVPTERFNLDENRHFEFYGRELFRTLSTTNADEFLSQHWYDSLRMAGKNPSMLGFFTETMLLSWIAVNGCSAAGPEFQKKPKAFLFDDAKPTMSRDSPCSLYIPVSFNYRAVDAILVAVDKQKDEAIITGVQITISRTHSDSEAKFFSGWEWWRDIVDCTTVSFRFLWIVEDVGQNPATALIQSGKRRLRSHTALWCPGFERRYVSVKDVSMDIGQKLENARKSAQ